MAMEATVVDTEDIEATMARGMLRPLLMLSLGTMATVDMVLDMDMVATDSVDTTVEAEDTTARGRLMPRLSPDMATDTDVDTDMEAMVMAVPMEDMGMEEDTMDKFHPITSFHTATFILVL